jgi:modulator of FtsH protease HflC
MNAESTSGSAPAPQTSGFRSRLRTLGIFALFLLALLVISGSVVFVDEGEYVIVERFGEIVAVYDQSDAHGLHWKFPWPIDSVRRFDRRVRLFHPPAREAISLDKKNITISAYVSWKIAENSSGTSENFADRPVVRFFQNLGSPEIAESRLEGRLRSLLSTELGQLELSQLLKITNSNEAPDEEFQSELTAIAQRIRDSLERPAIKDESSTQELGIEIVDLRIGRINFPVGNRQAVYDRMRSERQEEAGKYRNAGLAVNKEIRSRADLQYERILAKANADAKRIRDTADANAITIRNSAHARDPEFYETLRTLNAYKKILNERTTLVLSASSQLLKLLTNGIPNKPNSQKKTIRPNGLPSGGKP